MRPSPTEAPSAQPALPPGDVSLSPAPLLWAWEELGAKGFASAVPCPSHTSSTRALRLLFFVLIRGIRLKKYRPAVIPLSFPLSAARKRLRRERQPVPAEGGGVSLAGFWSPVLQLLGSGLWVGAGGD